MIRYPKPRGGLLRHPLENQVLVYDPEKDQVHLLDPITACVLDLLDEGGWTEEGMAAELAARLSVDPSPALFDLAVDELRNAGLIDESADAAAAAVIPTSSRRQLLGKLAMTGAAALLIPAIATLTATKGYALGSAQIGNGGPCTSNGNCLSGNCVSGTCQPVGGAGLGGACNTNAQCLSGHCYPRPGGTCVSSACKEENQACTTEADCCLQAAGNDCPSGTCKN